MHKSGAPPAVKAGSRSQGLPGELRTFVGQIQDVTSRDDPLSFWSCDSALRALLATEVVHDVLNHELACLAEDPAYYPANVTPGGHWLLLKVAGCTLTASPMIGPAQPSSRSYTNTEHAL